ncbi:MAG: ParB/RepB/Spo0J family partition protein [Clostridia bacterium]|nr:ParB/RepB/Spo0J family partition protein [Clostridia bacterium]
MKHVKNEIYYAEIYDIPIELITPNPNTTRTHFDSMKMNELVRTVQLYGIIQPVTVRRSGDMYELISGERRIRAALTAGLDMVPGIIVEADDEKSAIMTLLENLQREDLCFFEIAEGYKNLIRSQGLTQDELAKKIGISRSTVANKIRLLRLPPRVRRLVRDYSLSERHARALLALGDEDLQLSVIKHIHKDNLSAADSEKLIEDILMKHPEKQGDCVRAFKHGDMRVFSNTVSRAVDFIKESGVDAQMTSETHDWGSRFVIDLKKAAD